MEINFLPKPLSNGPSKWTVATTAQEFYAIQDQMGVLYSQRDDWEVGEDEAYTHFFDDMRLIVVCLNPGADLAFMVHEAVHVFEAMARHMGEHSPSEEFRAYSVQFIFEQILGVMAKLEEPKPRGMKITEEVGFVAQDMWDDLSIKAEAKKGKVNEKT